MDPQEFVAFSYSLLVSPHIKTDFATTTAVLGIFPTKVTQTRAVLKLDDKGPYKLLAARVNFQPKGRNPYDVHVYTFLEPFNGRELVAVESPSLEDVAMFHAIHFPSGATVSTSNGIEMRGISNAPLQGRRVVQYSTFAKKDDFLVGFLLGTYSSDLHHAKEYQQSTLDMMVRHIKRYTSRIYE